MLVLIHLTLGEIELTFVNDACRAANLTSLLRDPCMPQDLKELWPAFQKAFQSDRRGTRLSDSLAFALCGGVDMVVKNAKSTGRQALQHRVLLPLALQHIASQSPQGLFCTTQTHQMLNSCLQILFGAKDCRRMDSHTKPRIGQVVMQTQL